MKKLNEIQKIYLQEVKGNMCEPSNCINDLRDAIKNELNYINYYNDQTEAKKVLNELIIFFS